MAGGSEPDLTASGRKDSGEDKKKKKSLKELQRAFEVLPLRPSERYRALIDLTRQNNDLIEMADRKTRFALVILAALNAVNFVALSRSDLVTGAAAQYGIGVAVYVTFYVALSLYLCIEAIQTLKPRLSGALHQTADVSTEQRWLNLLSLDVMPNVPADDYYELWRTAQFSQLNREVAFRNQTMARIILKKYRALDRLFTGLTLLVILTLSLMVFFLYSRTAG